MTKLNLESKNYHVLEMLLKQSHGKNNLVLCVGSGINAECGYQWNDLMDAMLKSVLATVGIPRSGDFLNTLKNVYRDTYAHATIIKSVLGEERYRAILHNKIYEKYKQSDLVKYCRHSTKPEKLKNLAPKYDLLKRVAALCQTRTVHAVISYNYDDFLEQAITAYIADKPDDENSRKPVSVYCPEQYTVLSHNELPIYHVHGFLPDPNGLFFAKTGNLVLAFDEYFDTFTRMNSWQNTVQMHLLRNYCCLFIGSSLNDWNMLRMLQLTHNPSGECRRFALRCYSQIEGQINETESQIRLDRITTTLWNSVGLKPIFVGPDFKNINETVEALTVFLGNVD